jgi:hypothetical protein
LTCRDLAEHIEIFFVAAGFSVGVFYFFAAILASQLAGLPVETLALMRGAAWRGRSLVGLPPSRL